MCRARNQSISIARLHHHHAKIIDRFNGFECLLRRHSFGFSEFVKSSGIALEFIGGFRIDYCDAVQAPALFSERFGNCLFIAQQCDGGNAFFVDNVCRFADPFIASLGQDDGALLNFSGIDDLLNKNTSSHLLYSQFFIVKLLKYSKDRKNVSLAPSSATQLNEINAHSKKWSPTKF